MDSQTLSSNIYERLNIHSAMMQRSFERQTKLLAFISVELETTLLNTTQSVAVVKRNDFEFADFSCRIRSIKALMELLSIAFRRITRKSNINKAL